MKKDHPDLSVRRQCSLLSLARSSLYYQPRGESAENLAFMEIIDRQFLEPHGTARARWPATCGERDTDAGATGCDG